MRRVARIAQGIWNAAPRQTRATSSRRALFAALAAATLSWTNVAGADVKAYTAAEPLSAGGDRIQMRFASPTIAVTPGALRGHSLLDDAGAGTVTMSELLVLENGMIALDTTLYFGPGSFIFVEAGISSSPTPGQTGAGGTEPGMSIDWGVISGWSVTGLTFCLSSPYGLCPCDGSSAPPPGCGVSGELPFQPSATYDRGTWSFDPAGDYEASSYLQRTLNGGISSTSWLLRASFVGPSLPLLPAAGLAVTALAMLATGVRRLRRPPR